MLTARPARLEFELEQARALAETHLPDRLVGRLEPLHRARSYCLRTGDTETARTLATIESELRLPTAIVDVDWRGSELLLTIEAELRSRGTPVQLTRDPAGRLHREVDAVVRAALGQDQLDFAEIADTGLVKLGAKARDTREDWQVGDPGPFPLVPTGADRFVLRTRQQLTIDLTAALFGRPLERQPYDLSISATALGRRFHAAAPGPAGLVRYALIDGTGMIIYTNRDGRLSIDVGERFRIVAAQAAAADTAVGVTEQDGRHTVQLELSDVHVHGCTRLPGTLLLTRTGRGSDDAPIELDATLIGADGTARIRSSPTMINPGDYLIAVRFQGRTATTTQTITVPDRRTPLRRLAGLIKRS